MSIVIDHQNVVLRLADIPLDIFSTTRQCVPEGIIGLGPRVFRATPMSGYLDHHSLPHSKAVLARGTLMGMVLVGQAG